MVTINALPLPTLLAPPRASTKAVHYAALHFTLPRPRPRPGPTLPELDAMFTMILHNALDASETNLVCFVSADAAAQIDTRLPDMNSLDVPPAEGVSLIRSFLVQLWEAIVRTARHLPIDAPAAKQDTLVGILVNLRKYARGMVVTREHDLILWHDLPFLAQRIRGSEGSPARSGRAPPTYLQVQHWCNENAFAARCLEAGVGAWDDLGVRALHTALEMDDKTDGDGRWSLVHFACDVLAATQWMIHSGRSMHRWAQEHGDIGTGRWTVWKTRFQDLLDYGHRQAAPAAAAPAVAVPAAPILAPAPSDVPETSFTTADTATEELHVAMLQEGNQDESHQGNEADNIGRHNTAAGPDDDTGITECDGQVQNGATDTDKDEPERSTTPTVRNQGSHPVMVLDPMAQSLFALMMAGVGLAAYRMGQAEEDYLENRPS